MRFIARGHVRITGDRLAEPITAPNARRAAAIAQNWARENDLVYDGIETEAEYATRGGTPRLPLFESGNPELGDEISGRFGSGNAEPRIVLNLTEEEAWALHNGGTTGEALVSAKTKILDELAKLAAQS